MTMSCADLLDEWFESDILKAPMSVSGIIGTMLGVRSPGTAYVLLHHYMGEIDGSSRAWGFAKRGGLVLNELVWSNLGRNNTLYSNLGRNNTLYSNLGQNPER